MISKKNKADSPTRPRIIIGIDPGLANAGWGVLRVQGSRLVYLAHGSISTSPRASRSSRLAKLFTEFNTILDTWQPREAGMELLYFSKNVSSALPVAEARGVFCLALELRGIPLTEYQPMAIKQAVVGTSTADKAQVQELVRILLGLADIPKPDHAADALGAAICRAHELPALAQASAGGL